MHYRIAILLAVLGFGSPALAAERSASQAARRTPVVDVVERTHRAVVNISAKQVVETTVPFNIFDEFFGGQTGPRQTQRYTRTSLGSGFVIHPDGYVVTNAHVIVQAASADIVFDDNTKYQAEPVAIDERHDLAILRMKADKPFQALTLGRADDLMIGETVIAIGNPVGIGHTVTSGIISALNRKLDVSEDVVYEGLIQTDASINRGNSGGPLLNILGEVIGINTAIRGDAQNIGFAIPIDTLRKVLPEMLALERRKQRLEIGLRLGWRDRVRVVEARGPAAAAGIEPGDEVVSVDGRPVRHDVDFYFYLLRLQPQDRLVLELKRDGKPYKVTLHPRQIPIPDGARLLREKFGFAVKKLSRAEAEDLQIDGGLVITEVERGSPAAAARFEPGLIVVQIGQNLPTDLSEVGAQLETVKAGEKVTFRLWRIQRQYIRVYAVALTAR